MRFLYSRKHDQNFLKRKKRLFSFAAALIVLFFTSFYFLFTDFYTQAKFRTMQDRIDPLEKVDLAGLRELQASGGAFVNYQDLKKRFPSRNKKIIIVDAMDEYHGYIREIPTTFFGYHRQNSDLRYSIRRLIYTGTTEIRRELVIPPSEQAKKSGFEYKYFYIHSKSPRLSGAVDRFLLFFDTLPENVWVHFHCRLGKGRTSLMLLMFDIIKNAPKVALEDIVRRQFLLGSQNIFDTTPWKGGTYSFKALNQRKQFIQAFYTFICQRKAGGIQRWSDWVRSQQ